MVKVFFLVSPRNFSQNIEDPVDIMGSIDNDPRVAAVFGIIRITDLLITLHHRPDASGVGLLDLLQVFGIVPVILPHKTGSDHMGLVLGLELVVVLVVMLGLSAHGSSIAYLLGWVK